MEAALFQRHFENLVIRDHDYSVAAHLHGLALHLWHVLGHTAVAFVRVQQAQELRERHRILGVGGWRGPSLIVPEVRPWLAWKSNDDTIGSRVAWEFALTRTGVQCALAFAADEGVHVLKQMVDLLAVCVRAVLLCGKLFIAGATACSGNASDLKRHWF